MWPGTVDYSYDLTLFTGLVFKAIKLLVITG